MKRSKTTVIFWLLAALLVVGTADAVLYHAHQATHPKPSVTLYYNDGKTVLWQDNNPAAAPSSQPSKAPYFVDLVRAELQQRFGDRYYSQGSWKVTTSLDAKLQASAEELVANNLPAVASQTHGAADEEATVLEDAATGQIAALVGGTDRSNADHGLINFTTTPLAPDSSIKPFDYAALINTVNVGAGSVMSDMQTPMPGFPCTDRTMPSASGLAGNCLWNYDYKYVGQLPLRYALGTNRNVPAESIASAVGVQPVINLIHDMGANNGYNCYASADFSQKTQCYGAALLGDGAFLTLTDEAHALATLANGGQKLPQTTIVSATLNGKPKLSWQQSAGQQILKPDTAYIINDVMSDPNASYLPGSCDALNCSSLASGGLKFQRFNSWKFAVDSGVSYGNRSAVMASWSSKYVVASWVGNHAQNQTLTDGTNLATEKLVEPLTRGLMEAAHTGLQAQNWQRPSDIQTLPAFVLLNHVGPGDVEPSPATDIYPAAYQP